MTYPLLHYTSSFLSYLKTYFQITSTAFFYSVFFFLNDTAPPEISPLPLPAALPIPLQRQPIRRPPGERQRRRASPHAFVVSPSATAAWRDGSEHSAARLRSAGGVLVEEPPQRLIGRDRKSTRLNSSHGYISYAVFCL